MTPKGFTLVEVQLADGVTIDIYNLHTNAGATDADQKARASNLQQLSDFMTENSAGNAVVVMGDTNTRYTRELDTIREFIEGQNLTDGWVETVRDAPAKGSKALKCETATMTNECEVVDKIMFRGNNYLTLTLGQWKNENEAFMGKNGSPLGGPHGTRFTDVGVAAADQTVSSISIRAGNRIDGVALEVSDPTESTLSHGGTGGSLTRLHLASGEHITSMEVHWGKKKDRTRIFYLKFQTNNGLSVEGGTPTGSSATMTAPEGYQLSGFHGRAGDSIDALGAIFTRIESTTQQQQHPTYKRKAKMAALAVK
nr:hypothetical protein PF009_g24818 [Phytophthora fragariae]